VKILAMPPVFVMPKIWWGKLANKTYLMFLFFLDGGKLYLMGLAKTSSDTLEGKLIIDGLENHMHESHTKSMLIKIRIN
jgi:hypothetical protein